MKLMGGAWGCTVCKGRSDLPGLYFSWSTVISVSRALLVLSGVVQLFFRGGVKKRSVAAFTRMTMQVGFEKKWWETCD